MPCSSRPLAIACPVAIAVLCLLPRCGAAGEGFVAEWLARVSRTQAEQPHWVTPLVTVTPRLEQEFRYDFVWQSQPFDRWQTVYGNSKGLELIPTEHTEVIVGVPSYFERNHQRDDGFGDLPLLLKYRLLSANEANGNYIVTGFLGVTIPTGNREVSARHAVYTPTLAFGKGWGDFDVQSTLAVRVPDSAFYRLGTPFVGNIALQYRLFQRLWPEVEANVTSWPNGEHSGHTEVFLTPGLVVGRFPLYGRLAFAFGAGVQLAATGYRTANQNWIVSLRLPF